MAKAPTTRVKKKRAARKGPDIAAVVEAVADVTVSKVNKEAVRQFAKAQKAVERANDAVIAIQARADKAKEAIAAATTGAAKAKQRERAASLRASVADAKAAARTAAAEMRTAERLVIKLHKAHQKAHAAYLKGYERSAAAALKAAGKKPRRRKKVMKAPEPPAVE